MFLGLWACFQQNFLSFYVNPSPRAVRVVGGIKGGRSIKLGKVHNKTVRRLLHIYFSLFQSVDRRSVRGLCLALSFFSFQNEHFVKAYTSLFLYLSFIVSLWSGIHNQKSASFLLLTSVLRNSFWGGIQHSWFVSMIIFLVRV